MKILSLSINDTPIQVPTETQNIVNSAGAGPFGDSLLRFGIQSILIIIILLAVGYMLYGGIKFITSRGDKEQFKQAREHVVYALIGLLIALGSFLAISVISKVFGVNLIGF